MIWQDITIAVAGYMFGLIVIPQILDSYRQISYVNVWTAFLTVIGLIVLGISFLTLDLCIAATSNFFNCAMWSILLYFSIEKIRRKKYASTLERSLDSR